MCSAGIVQATRYRCSKMWLSSTYHRPPQSTVAAKRNTAQLVQRISHSAPRKRSLHNVSHTRVTRISGYERCAPHRRYTNVTRTLHERYANVTRTSPTSSSSSLSTALTSFAPRRIFARPASADAPARLRRRTARQASSAPPPNTMMALNTSRNVCSRRSLQNEANVRRRVVPSSVNQTSARRESLRIPQDGGEATRCQALTWSCHRRR